MFEEKEKEVEKEEIVEKKSTKKATKKKPVEKKELIAASGFYYKGTHYKTGDDLSSLKQEDIEFLTEKGKVKK